MYRETEKLGKLVSGPPGCTRQRQRSKPFAVIGASGAGLCLAVLAAAIWLKPSWLSANEVDIRGCGLTDAAEVLARLAWHPGGTENISACWTNPINTDGLVWVQSLQVMPAGLRRVTVDVVERHPLAIVERNSEKRWLCDNGQLVPLDHVRDAGLIGKLKLHPRIHLSASTAWPDSASGSVLAEAAAGCHSLLPGGIKRIDVAHDGMVKLIDAQGLEIHMGGLEGLNERIAALPKLLRTCEADRPLLRSLDASDPCVVYKQWTTAPPGKAKAQ